MATRPRQRIDINTASAPDIERACGIDGVLAQRIIAYREEHGPFKDREDLDAVPGFADIRTEEVLSAVGLPRHNGGSNRSVARSSGKQTAARGGRHERSDATPGPGAGSRPSRTSGSKSGTSANRRRSRSAEPVTDHDFIRSWVEERGGWPARVKGTGRSKGDTGMIRIDFPGFSGSDSLERIEWDEWFEQFDSNGLAFLHRDMRHSDGELDRFNKLVRRTS
jgi:competence ComEA-like helix-hairpin-helix protein